MEYASLSAFYNGGYELILTEEYWNTYCAYKKKQIHVCFVYEWWQTCFKNHFRKAMH